MSRWKKPNAALVALDAAIAEAEADYRHCKGKIDEAETVLRKLTAVRDRIGVSSQAASDAPKRARKPRASLADKARAAADGTASKDTLV